MLYNVRVCLKLWDVTFDIEATRYSLQVMPFQLFDLLAPKLIPRKRDHTTGLKANGLCSDADREAGWLRGKAAKVNSSHESTNKSVF